MASLSRPSEVPAHRSFGIYSLILAVLAFAVFTAGFGLFVRVPRATEAAQWIAQWFAIVGFLGLVSLIELAGIVLGGAALFRSGDRKALGLLGAALNLLQLVGGVGATIMMIAYGLPLTPLVSAG